MSFSILLALGTVALGVVIAFGVMRWRQFQRDATPGQIAARDQKIRENFDKAETRPTGPGTDVRR